jgi:hypothetical protein
MEETTIDDGVETSITDEVDSDLDMIGGTKNDPGYVEQDTL